MTLEGEALVFARTIGFLSRAPGFSHKAISPFIRAALSFALTLLIAPTVDAKIHLRDGSLFFSLVSELVIGAILGFACATLYNGVDAGSAALDDFVGIRGTNPTAGPLSGNGIARLWSFVFTTAYFSLGGYALVLFVFADGLHSVPPGAIIDPARWTVLVERFPQLILEAALVVAGPALMIGMLTQFGLSALARIVPRFSVQAITFGVTFGVVLLVTIATLPLILPMAGHAWIPSGLPGLAHEGSH
jgi:flagellar biosynthesis protein FliR